MDVHMTILTYHCPIIRLEITPLVECNEHGDFPWSHIILVFKGYMSMK